MFKLNKIINVLIIFLVCITMVGCKEKTNEQEDYINIKQINAEVYNSNSSERYSRKNTFNSIFSFENEDLDTHQHTFIDGVCSCGAKDPDYIVQGLISAGQYVVLFKSETEIQFTITLNNPKAESIDAIELTCDDPASQILMDGKYENIQYSDDKTIIVNWSQENPYKKTYQIKTTSEETIQTLKVVDIKVNGEWQNKELSNDELKIYKIEDNDVAIKTVNNNIEEYSFNVVICENVKKYNVIFQDKFIEADADGVYHINESGAVKVRYTYDFNGIEVEWENEWNIELFGFNFADLDPNHPPKLALQLIFMDGGVRLEFTGTDIINEYIEYIYLNKEKAESVFLYYNKIYRVYQYDTPDGLLPEDLRFYDKYNWEFVDIQNVTTTDFYIRYLDNLYRVVIGLDYEVILELVEE